MGLHRLADLDAAHGRLVQVADSLAGHQLHAVGETQGVDARIDLGDDIALLVLVQSAGQLVQVVTAAELAHNPLDAAVLLDLHLHPRHRRLAGGNLDAFQIQVGIGAGQALYRDAAHVDLLHQPLVVGVQSVEPVDLVVFGLVGGRVAHDEQRVELAERVERLGSFHLLRLVEKQDRPVGLDHVDGATGLEVVQLLVDASVVLALGVECLDVDHHDVDAGVRGEALQVVQLLGAVDEEARLLAVSLQEVLGSDLQRLVDPLADGNARHHDDELAPAVALVQLEHAADVAVGLASAGFHLDVEVDRAAGLLAVHQDS